MSGAIRNPNLRILLIALSVLFLDQLTKVLVQRNLLLGSERVVIDGFFRLVHWGNTGAAWSLFKDNNTMLTGVAIVAVVALVALRHQFEIHRPLGQLAMGLMLGGITGNLVDRFRMHHVIDFLYFYTNQRGGTEIGFPAFNIADSAICTGVGILLLLSWQREEGPETAHS